MAPILAALFAATFPCREGPDDLARLFPEACFLLFAGREFFVAMNMPQGPFQPLHANGIRNEVFGTGRSIAAYMRSMSQQLGPYDPESCQLSMGL